MSYWHAYEFRHIMRPIAARYPVTYSRIGSLLESKGFLQTQGADLSTEWFAILAAMPPHIKPWEHSSNDPRTWAEIDWTRSSPLVFGQLMTKDEITPKLPAFLS